MHNSVLDDLDVVVVGAGLSGIGAASQLRRSMPQRSLAVLEARPRMDTQS